MSDAFHESPSPMHARGVDDLVEKHGGSSLIEKQSVPIEVDLSDPLGDILAMDYNDPTPAATAAAASVEPVVIENATKPTIAASESSAVASPEAPVVSEEPVTLGVIEKKVEEPKEPVQSVSQGKEAESPQNSNSKAGLSDKVASEKQPEQEPEKIVSLAQQEEEEKNRDETTNAAELAAALVASSKEDVQKPNTEDTVAKPESESTQSDSTSTKTTSFAYDAGKTHTADEVAAAATAAVAAMKGSNHSQMHSSVQIQLSNSVAALAAALAPTLTAAVNASNAANKNAHQPPRTFPAYNGGDGLDSASGRWSKQEDDQLRKAVEELGARNWKRIASNYLGDKRTDVQCLHRWQKVLKPGLVKGPWSPEEDETIKECMSQGITRWSEIAKRVPGRIGKQCRERWFNHLDPTIKKTEWTKEEDQQLIIGQAALGNKWSQIAKMYLPGRPENAVKNRWNAATRRRRTGDSSIITAQSLVPTNSSHHGSTPSTLNDASNKRRTGPAKKRGTFAEGLEGLAGLCATVKPEVPADGKARMTKMKRQALKEEEKKARRELREQEKATKRSAKVLEKNTKKKRTPTKKRDFPADDDASSANSLNGAAALLAAAGELNDMPSSKRSKRGSSFVASRPDLSAPSVSTTKSAPPSADTTTPNWTSASNLNEKNISPPNSKIQDASSGLDVLSSVVSGKSRPKRSTRQSARNQ